MASSSAPLLLILSFCCLLSLLSSATSSTNPKPHALVLPVKKDRATGQYVTRILQRTPLTTLSFVVDLGQRFLWVDCESNYVSSSYRPVICGTPDCNLIKTPFGCGSESYSPPRPGNTNNSCSVLLDGPTVTTSGDLNQDLFAFRSTDGSNPGPLLTTRNFIFGCAPNFVLKGLARGASGIAGLGRDRIGMPVQLAVEFGLRPKFALCLSSSTTADGVIFFGDGPYNLLPNVAASQSLIHTPLFVNRVSTAGSYYKGEKSVEYFIGVKSIKINDKTVPVNSTLLPIDRHGNGGTKISTLTPYTTMETSIYEAVTGAFAASLSKVKRVAAVGNFSVCYSAKDLGSTRVGPGVPAIDLVLQNEKVYWRMFGANTMVEAKPGVLCLAFLDGGLNPRTSIVVGGYQLEDNLLQFDLKNSTLGFSSSLLFRQTTCGNFNFTGKA